MNHTGYLPFENNRRRKTGDCKLAKNLPKKQKSQNSQQYSVLPSYLHLMISSYLVGYGNLNLDYTFKKTTLSFGRKFTLLFLKKCYFRMQLSH